MKFTRLKLHGFKSFCDQTELLMEPGLTGVVGPNGCGKSNLVEALRWVMGESSYKAMRASGMDDVIFSGSGNRPGRNSAEVTLVLDNVDRTAPAALNNADILEVTRRIEREEGSVYRVNGREVRARDVQLLFADASTGAHSPALVRQGQIGELIAAKPTQRRALLEEAAGISGLHSRRHEAELRLRGAEQNLERVDDVIAQVETQLETLKKQARLAIRYRAISGDIRKTESALYHVRWVAARFAEKEAEAQQGKLVVALGDAMSAERAAQKVLDAADSALQPLRDREAATGAVLQRLTILSEQLADEARRANTRRAELEDRLRQLAADAERERALVDESEETLEGYAEERARLEEEVAGEQDAFDAARAAAEEAARAVSEADQQARAAADALSQLRARRAQAMRSAEEARQRVARLTQQIADIDREAAGITASLDADETLSVRRRDLEAAQERSGEAEESAVAAEEETQKAQSALDAARPRLSEVETALGRLESEADTLSRILNAGGASLWPAIVDQLTVAPGYETALGAALGDDLEASSDAGAPMHWAGPMDGDGDPALPQGAEPLSRYVSGSAVLKRRLDQIGLVDKADGVGLMHALKSGQRLVTLEGDLWRWDGYVAAADAPSAAAQRLAQRNRLAELDAEIVRMRGERNAWKRDVEALAAALEAARAAEREKHEYWRAAQREIAVAQAEVEKAAKAIGDLTTRQSALAETRTRLEASLSEAEAFREETEAVLEEAGDEGEASDLAQERQSALLDAREAAEQVRLKLGTFETSGRMRAARLAQIATDTANWQRRRDGAAGQLSTLGARRGEVEAQLATMDATPESFETRRAELDDQIEDAQLTHKAASDALAQAQTGYREADKTHRAAVEGLSGARENLARVEERLKGFIAQRHQIEQLVRENLGIDASRTAEAAGIRPEDALPNEQATEQKLERLKAERERLGGVNLTAEREAEEVREKLEGMVKDRDDLIEAIAKLRAGIQSLNREGRHRLSEAFDKVNAHFQELFTSLFGGGTAELKFVESDDPLEAGLEIIARPPGKKPQTMTLLSGGEQALTAMSLIFAVFLTNPAPICVLDEVDAPLDDANVERFCNLLESMRQRTDTRFLTITHNPITMSRMDRLFGVTMAERGVSQLVSVDLKTAESFLEAV
ncbi:chromosome partition protein Smc [Youhaiella tibetensis]|uniref:Chromosome partition protein Smc n=1 Tax=Paradevosia tibetensis TaxID=1447062 RepID=A0A5B9DKB3_9HYPH|nr:AAA family ATPase [Youhaiella tibetensis]AKR54513.1 Chromosome partition protein smc [Devosia sp. H5989]QEE19634.1 AAA family ATPase [Youhaiella tibetensis]GGF31343.1 chromosome partition protein Smc [Youhaiella tibetensis]